MKTKKELNQIILGIIMLLIMHSAVLVILVILAYIIRLFNTLLAANIILPIFYIGLLQLLYVIPAVIWLRQKQQWGRMKGVLVGAGITALLNVGLLALWLLSFK